MLPKSLVCASVADPVSIHVGEEGGLAGGGQDSGYVGVGARCIAVGVEGSVAMVWPIDDEYEKMREVVGPYHRP